TQKRSGRRRSESTSRPRALLPKAVHLEDRITPIREPMVDKFKDECGVFGIFGHPEAANLTYLGLYALQHRGQESAGIAASDGGQIRHRKAMGYVNEAFNAEALGKL